MSLFPEIDKEIKLIEKMQNAKIQELKEKSTLYRPSNNIEGELFEQNQCSTCKKYNKDRDSFKQCQTLMNLMASEIEDVIKYKSKIMCLKHTNFNIKSYMGVEL